MFQLIQNEVEGDLGVLFQLRMKTDWEKSNPSLNEMSSSPPTQTQHNGHMGKHLILCFSDKTM